MSEIEENSDTADFFWATGMGTAEQIAAQLAPSERRQYERFPGAFRGTIFLAEQASTTDCVVVDLSAGGAAVRCTDPLPNETAVVLYIDGFGRYDAVIVRYIAGVLGLRFVCGDAKRKRLVEKLNRYVRDGITDVTTLRAYKRVSVRTELFYTRFDGEQINCEVMDVSLQGLSLKTRIRPSINEIIQVGQTRGRVVRHHADGIGIEFVATDIAQISNKISDRR